MELVVVPGPAELAEAAAALIRARVAEKPDLVMAVPAGRTPRRMYAVLKALQARAPIDYSRMCVFCIDELCPPAPADGYFWRQIRAEFLAWAGVPVEQCHRFEVDGADLDAMCGEYDARITKAGGLDLVMLGLGPNAHLASNEPGSAFESETRSVMLLDETVRYILSDDVIQGDVSARAVTLGPAAILAAREVIVLASGAKKRAALRAALRGPVTPDVPASILQRHPRCLVLADRDASPDI